MKNITLAALLLCASSLSAQSFFQAISENIAIARSGKERTSKPLHYQTFSTDLNALSAVLAEAPMEFTDEADAKQHILHLPQPDGSFEAFAVWKVAACEDGMYQLHPELRTFGGVSLRRPGVSVRGSITVLGFKALILTPEAGGAWIEPYTPDQTDYYIVYDRKDIPEDMRLPQAGDLTAPLPAKDQLYTPAATERGGADLVRLKVFRFAASCTGEFGIDHGGTVEKASAAVIEYTNFASSIFERDIQLRLKLVAGNDKVIHVDPANDPFTGNENGALASQNITLQNTVIGVDHFDIGHVYVRGGGGVALSLGNACSVTKAGGCTAGSGSGSYGEDFVGIICQEVGHQLGGQHTWNRCGPGNGQRSGNTAYEPGSGSTIMSYGGGCGSDNVAGGSDLYFHGGSISEIAYFVEVGTNNCGTFLNTTNNTPVVLLPYKNNFYIPIKTPFELAGQGIDIDNDALTYCWEGMDAGPESTMENPVGNTAIFRSRPPVKENNRYFPKLSTVLSNQSDRTETLPAYNRDLSFRLTVRDGKGGVGQADVEFRAAAAAGPFLVLSPNNSAAVWRKGEFVEVVWDPAHTEAAPVNCRAVNIRLSTDGGATWPIMLAQGVNNDGKHIVKVPDLVSNAARVRIDGADNVFFDVSNANFRIIEATAPALSVGLKNDGENICLPGQYTTELLTVGLGGYNESVSLDLAAPPATGVNVSFGAKSVVAGQSIPILIDMNDADTSGSYVVKVRVSAKNLPDQILPITLKATRNDFSALQQLAPLDGAVSQSQIQILRWQKAPDALSYDVQVARSPSFTANTIVATKTATSLDTFAIPFLLDKGSAYYWRVRPNNGCSPHPWEEASFFATFSENCTVFTASDLPKNITANGTPTIQSVINIPVDGIISDLNVRQVDGSHNYFGDLEVSLVSPTGTEVSLWKKRCSNFSNAFNFGLDDASSNLFTCPPSNARAFVKPASPLAAFNGQNTYGPWTLKVKDNVIGSGGNLDTFRLDICSSVSLSIPILVRNKPLEVKPGAGKALSADFLFVEDAEQSAAQLVYTLVSIPQWGVLEKAPAGVLKVGDQFTQADINSGALRYARKENETAEDFFRFSVSDGTGGYLGTPKFIFTTGLIGTDEIRTKGPAFALSPNPAADAVNIQLERPLESAAQIRIYDISGRTVLQERLNAGASRALLSLQGLPKGVYAVRMQSETGEYARKLVVH